MVVELPAGSNVEGSGQLTDFRCDGRLGDCRIRTAMGQIQLDSVDKPRLRSGVGDILVDRVEDARSDQEAAKETFKTALERFSEVVKQPDTDLKKKYDALSSELGRCEKRASTLSGRIDSIEDVSEELWDEIVDANLKSAYLCCQAVVPYMKSRRHHQGQWGTVPGDGRGAGGQD